MYFTVPTRIYFGENAETALQKLKSPFVVADVFFKENPDFLKLLHKFDQHTLFTDFTPDPTLSAVASGVAAFKNAKAESILAIGGGSAIDTAKAIMYFANVSVPFAVIPTTSGTGSEVTSFSVVTNPETKTKYPLISDSMLPDIAVLDMQFINNLPPEISAVTGADALCHAIESYVAKSKNPFSDALAEKAITLIMKHLQDAVKGDLKAREQVHFASTMAGIAFNSAGLGICHGLAHAMGARFKIPHGKANAILLPHVIAFNAKDTETEKRYATLSRLLGNEGGTVMLVRKFISDIRKLFQKIGIPERFDIDTNTFAKKQTEIADAVLQDACTPNNPVVIHAEDVINLYKEVL